MAFKKGISGNPGGRPKVPSEFKRQCSDFTDTHVLEAWKQEVVDRGEHWVRASELLAAYGKGKPPQSIEHSTPEGEGGLKIVVEYVDAKEGK
jgi:hypothetical protein